MSTKVNSGKTIPREENPHTKEITQAQELARRVNNLFQNTTDIPRGQIISIHEQARRLLERLPTTGGCKKLRENLELLYKATDSKHRSVHVTKIEEAAKKILGLPY